MIDTPGHGKDIVDGINACDKRYLKSKMCMVGNPQADDCNKRMLPHSMIGNAHHSFAEECKRLCYINGRENGAKRFCKYKNVKIKVS